MNRPTSWSMWPAALVTATVLCSPLFAQAPGNGGPHRKLAPGVLETVDPARKLDESFSRHDVVELLAVDPAFDWAKDVTFRHDVWMLEFKFKPMRMVWVDIPQASGRMKKKLIWYMVYSVTNSGEVMHPVPSANKTYKVEYRRQPVRFLPEFLLESPEFKKVYPDRVIPVAVGPIQLREDRTRRFYTSVEISREIAVGQTLWGVATWEDVDPRVDRFSVYVKGLTNAYRWRDMKGTYKKGDPILTGRRLSRKTLMLNFWRPGDEYFENEKEIRYGIPGEVDYEWVYR